MSEISIAISVVGLMGSISSILFAYLAFKRNEKKRSQRSRCNKRATPSRHSIYR